MASRDIFDLDASMRSQAAMVGEICADHGVSILIYCTRRSLEEQARLYRKSRSLAQIERKVDSLINRDYVFLAKILLDVGPQKGRIGEHVTNCGPGESWHNFGLAFDAVPLQGGKPAWSFEAAPEAWTLYGEVGEGLGLTWSGRWKTFREYPHMQLAEGSNPLKNLDPKEAKARLKNLGLL